MQLATLAIYSLLEGQCSSYSVAGFHPDSYGGRSGGLELFYGSRGSTYTLEEFMAIQQLQGEKAKCQLAELRSKVIGIVKKACQVSEQPE